MSEYVEIKTIVESTTPQTTGMAGTHRSNAYRACDNSACWCWQRPSPDRREASTHLALAGTTTSGRRTGKLAESLEQLSASIKDLAAQVDALVVEFHEPARKKTTKSGEGSP